MVKKLSSVATVDRNVEEGSSRAPGLESDRQPPAHQRRDPTRPRHGESLDNLLLKTRGLDTYEKLHPIVERLLSRLDKREAEVLRMRYGIDDGYPKTWGEIASCFQISQEQACEISGRALEKLHLALARRKQVPVNN